MLFFHRFAVVVVSWTLLWCSLCHAQDLGEEPQAGNASDLRIITYNVQFLPDPVSWKNKRRNPLYRVSRIAEELSDFDLAALQETFHDQHRDTLVSAIRTTWNDALHVVFSPHPEGFHTNGGNLLLSRRPILKSATYVYKNFSSPAEYGLSADGHAAKGILFARIARSAEEPDNFIDVFATHLEARQSEMRVLQFKELADFIEKESDAEHPVLVLGDLNSYGMIEHQQEPQSEYSQLMRELKAVRRGMLVDLWPQLNGDTLGGTTSQESADIGKRIDYILVSNPPPPGVQLEPRRIAVDTFQDEKVVALSDHNAVVADIYWPTIMEITTPQAVSPKP